MCNNNREQPDRYGDDRKSKWTETIYGSERADSGIYGGAVNIKKIWELLGNLIGESYDEELLDNLFSRFCLGK